MKFPQTFISLENYSLFYSTKFTMADDMDIALMANLDLLPSSSTTSTKSTSFKPLRFHPKPRGATTAPSATAKTPIKPKIEPNDPMPTPPVPMSSSPDTNPKIKPDTDPKIEAHVEEEDEVEREIDVFLTPFSLDENETEVIFIFLWGLFCKIAWLCEACR